MTNLHIFPASDADAASTDFGFIYRTYVELDLAVGHLSIEETHRDNNGTPAAVWHGHTVRWDVRKADAATYDALLEAIAPYAQALVDSYESVWDGSNHVGVTDAPDAEAAIDALTGTDDVYTFRDTAFISADAENDYLQAEGERGMDAANDEVEALMAALADPWAAEWDGYRVTFSRDGTEYGEGVFLFTDYGPVNHIEREFNEAFEGAQEEYDERLKAAQDEVDARLRSVQEFIDAVAPFRVVRDAENPAVLNVLDPTLDVEVAWVVDGDGQYDITDDEVAEAVAAVKAYIAGLDDEAVA